MDTPTALLIVLLVIFSILLLLIIIFFTCWYIKKRRNLRLRQNLRLTDETPLIDHLSQPIRQHAQQQERSSLLTCHFWIRTTGDYIFHSQLTQLGSDPDKSWFLVTPISKTNTTNSSNLASHLLTIQPKSDRLNHLIDEESTIIYIRTLNNLFSRLHYPYVEPIIRLDILYTQKLVVTVKKYQRLGSLKDLLHGVQPTANFHVYTIIFSCIIEKL